MLMSVEMDIQETLDIDELIEQFPSAAPHRMNLIAFLSVLNRHCWIDNFIFVSTYDKNDLIVIHYNIRPLRWL